MKREVMVTVMCLGLFLNATGGMEENEKKVGDTAFLAYEGSQIWPVSNKVQIIKDYAVPIYIGLPTQRYEVMGRIYDTRQSGFEAIERMVEEGFSSEKDRQRNCAHQAQLRGGDAVLVTGDKSIIQALGLTEEDLEKTTPLFDHKNKVTLVIKFVEPFMSKASSFWKEIWKK